MNWITYVLTLGGAFFFLKFLFNIGNKIQYQNRLKEFQQLKRIYLYLNEFEKSPEKAKTYLKKDIKIEGKWLYTKKFYFDLHDGQIWNRMEIYLMEYFNYFLWKGNRKEKVYKEIISLKFA